MYRYGIWYHRILITLIGKEVKKPFSLKDSNIYPAWEIYQGSNFCAQDYVGKTKQPYSLFLARKTFQQTETIYLYLHNFEKHFQVYQNRNEPRNYLHSLFNA